MRVSVTREDIRDGYRGNGERCPVALAIDRATQMTRVRVLPDRITVNDRWYTTPAAVTAWVRAFDEGRRVRPFEFDLPD